MTHTNVRSSLFIAALLAFGLVRMPVLGSEVEMAVEPKVISFAEMRYPLVARLKGIQGSVVLSGTVGEEQTLSDITLIFGTPELSEGCKDNVRQWKFANKPNERVVVVYLFRISTGICILPCNSQMLFWPQGIVTVTIGQPAVTR